MTFQYFFFSTYIGYFLQALPFALIAGLVYGLIKYKNDTETPIIRKIFSCAFVCYLTGLICITLLLDLIASLWYFIFYFMPSGRHISFFSGGFNFELRLQNIGGERLVNLLLLVPFAILYPLSVKAPKFRATILTGILLVFAIEIIQPVFGRAFDINDIILNTAGILASTALFFSVKSIIKRTAR